MLYKKKKTQTLDTNLFINPTSEYRATPFWSWNCKLNKQTLLTQIEHFNIMGFGGFHMHSRTGLATEYLGDEFMDMVKSCCDKAEDLNMLAWLYDEDRWSSGPAGGKVTKHKPYRRKRLMLFCEDKGWNTKKAEALKKGEPYLLAVYDVVLDADGYLDSYRRININDTANGTKWFAYCVNEKEDAWFNYQTYIDAMDKQAVAKFINVTHERYKEVIGDRFGKSVPAIFTDEPNANHEKDMFLPTPVSKDRQVFTWTRFFEEEYIKMYGEDFLDKLPELAWNKKDKSDSITKYRYFNFVAHQFSQNFSKQIGDWCKQNGIDFTGHYLREPKLLEQATTCGEIMRNYGYMGIPGIDMLCNFYEFTTAKQAQSAAHQYGKEGVLSELYGVTGWDFDFRGHKLQGDWQAALGVSVRVPHLAWVSMKGEAKRDYPAAIGYQSPWYTEYSYIENHFARVNTALTRGTPIVKVGVIHPVESVWIASGPKSQTSTVTNSVENNFLNVTNWLISNHLDFDYICESTLPNLANGCAVGKMHYDTVVVPGCLTLRQTTLDFLKAFKQNGGEVVFMGGCPEFVDGVKSNVAQKLYSISKTISFDCAELVSALSNVKCVTIKDKNGFNADKLVYALRQDTDCKWLFIAHSGEQGKTRHSKAQNDVIYLDELTITIKGEYIPTLYDTLTGEIYQLDYTHTNNTTKINYTLEGYGSILLKLTETPVAEPKKQQNYNVVNQFDIKTTVDYSLSEPNVLLLDIAKYSYDGGAVMPEEEVLRISKQFRNMLNYRSDQTQPYAMSIDPPSHKVTLYFDFESEIEIDGALLAVEDADSVKITFNGQPVKNNVTGYFTDESIGTVPIPCIKQGTNSLVLEFAYGERTNIEWCYILGDFGVELQGCQKTLVKAPKKLGFGDVSRQKLPFYAANVNYTFDVELEKDGAVEIEASCYRGSLISVQVDGVKKGRIVLPPYKLLVDSLKAGKHKVTLTLYGNRNNSFAPLHNANSGNTWIGPDAWRTEGVEWSYEYNLKPLGILKSPIIKILEQLD